MELISVHVISSFGEGNVSSIFDEVEPVTINTYPKAPWKCFLWSLFLPLLKEMY